MSRLICKNQFKKLEHGVETSDKDLVLGKICIFFLFRLTRYVSYKGFKVKIDS